MRQGKSVSPEDYTTVWGWASFRWIMPLLERGSERTLNEEDVWQLSPRMQARPVHAVFSRATGRLLKRIWDNNKHDLFLDFVLTYISITFRYASPFFLKRILDALDEKEPDARKRGVAFVYAFLAFACALVDAQASVQHLWFSRRACTRIRTGLMVAIYDKALKRRDFSGIVDKEVKKAPPPGSAKEDKKANEPKAGANIGKIVNLMAGDASRIAELCPALYFLHGAPYELVVACVFLYQ